MYLTSYSVTALRNGSWWDVASYLHDYSKHKPTFYPLKELVCDIFWDKEKLYCPGFGTADFLILPEEKDSILA